MSVQTEIDRIITAVQAAHEKVLAKGGTTAQPYLVGNLESAIDTIPTGSDPVLQTKTVTPTTSLQTVNPDSGYDGLSKVTVNAMPTATQATPSITVSSSGLITASATQSAGYVASGTKSATKQLTTQATKTITPSTSQQTAVASGRYTTGAVIVKGDANLKAENIKSGVSIFGVSGSYDGSGGGSGSGGSVETCTVNITMSSGYNVNGYGAIQYENGTYSATWKESNYDGKPFPVTLTNVVCNSLLHVHFYAVMPASKVTGNCICLNSGSSQDLYFLLSADPNETISIELYDKD